MKSNMRIFMGAGLMLISTAPLSVQALASIYLQRPIKEYKKTRSVWRRLTQDSQGKLHAAAFCR
jgi:hypothetical protein